nr:MAG TPA: hypothetical protein [Caudoviricetes sp.]
MGMKRKHETQQDAGSNSLVTNNRAYKYSIYWGYCLRRGSSKGW